MPGNYRYKLCGKAAHALTVSGLTVKRTFVLGERTFLNTTLVMKCWLRLHGLCQSRCSSWRTEQQNLTWWRTRVASGVSYLYQGFAFRCGPPSFSSLHSFPMLSLESHISNRFEPSDTAESGFVDTTATSDPLQCMAAMLKVNIVGMVHVTVLSARDSSLWRTGFVGTTTRPPGALCKSSKHAISARPHERTDPACRGTAQIVNGDFCCYRNKRYKQNSC